MQNPSTAVRLRGPYELPPRYRQRSREGSFDIKEQAHMVRLSGPCVGSPLPRSRARRTLSKHPYVMTNKVRIRAGQHHLGVVVEGGPRRRRRKRRNREENVPITVWNLANVVSPILRGSISRRVAVL